MRYKYNNVPKDVPIWGTHYQLTSEKEIGCLKCKPVLGIVINDHGRYNFHIIGKNEKPNATCVRVSSRVYSDTEEECIEMYNELVQQAIKNLSVVIDHIREDLI